MAMINGYVTRCTRISDLVKLQLAVAKSDLRCLLSSSSFPLPSLSPSLFLPLSMQTSSVLLARVSPPLNPSIANSWCCFIALTANTKFVYFEGGFKLGGFKERGVA